MIASIANSYATTTVLRSPSSRSVGTAFTSILTDASSVAVSPPSIDQATISPAAKQAAMVQAQAAFANFDTNYSNIDHLQTDFVNHYAEGAKLVSAAQGLAEGQYDFTRISDKQLFVVANDIILNHGGNCNQISAMINFVNPTWNGPTGAQTPTYSDAPVNLFAQLKESSDYSSQHGFEASARLEKSVLSMITTMHEAAGIPVSYDKEQKSDTHTDFADSITKLNEALSAFKKEASLTPAQRARRDVLKTMNLTEDAIKAMPPEQQKATEQKIAEGVSRRLRLGQGGKDQAASTSVDTL